MQNKCLIMYRLTHIRCVKMSFDIRACLSSQPAAMCSALIEQQQHSRIQLASGVHPSVGVGYRNSRFLLLISHSNSKPENSIAATAVALSTAPHITLAHARFTF